MKEQTGTILIVDDDPELSSSLAGLFGELGYRAETVNRAEEAIARAEKHSFNLALLDMRLPDLVSTDLLARLKELHPEMVVIMITGFATLESAIDSLHQGAYAYVVRPITLDKIAPIVEQALRKQQDVLQEQELVAPEKKGKAAYWELSIVDSLTQLYNRRHFHKLLAREIAISDRYEHPLAVLMIDIDGFQRYNEAHGLPSGDKALKEIAALLRSLSRRVDIVARYGGEEFAVVTPETDKKGALTLATRLREAVENTVFETDTGSRDVKLTISVGIACYPSDAEEGEELIYKALQALSKAKKGGGNTAILFKKGKRKPR